MPTPTTTLAALTTSLLPTGISVISIDTTVLAYTVFADINTSQIEVSAYNQIFYNKTPTLVNNQNQFVGSIPIDPTQGSIFIQITGRNYDPRYDLHTNPTAWNYATSYSLGYRLVDLNGYVQIVTIAGISASSTDTTIPVPLTPDYPSFNQTTGEITIDGSVTWTCLGFNAITPTLKFGLIPTVSGNGSLIGPPSALRSYKAQTVCRIEWAQPTYAGTIGTRVMLSTDPDGLNPVYVQYGGIVPPSQLSRSSASILATESTSAVNGAAGTQTTTTVNTLQQNNYNYIDVPQTDISGTDIFYAMLSTVVQDPITHTVFESQQSGPITCGFVNLKLVALSDFLALQRKEDIAGRMITQVNRNYPNLDLSPRSELRDLMIDPVAIEMSNMSVREWFARSSQSVSALAQLDDANGDGFSDPFNSSPIKQQLSRAFGTNASDTQSLIDSQFDVLGERAGLTRLGATSSVTDVTFYTYTQPTSTVTFGLGLIVSTVPDAQTPGFNFITTGSSSINPTSANAFYDPINGWWSIAVPASCQSSGSTTNVGAGTIRSASSNVPSGWYCTNLASASGGQDDEINSSYAARIENRLITGVDSGTTGGYRDTALKTPGISSAIVVAAGDTEMLRDWDNIRQKHVNGCVDVYVKGSTFSEQDEVIAFQYTNTGTYGFSPTYLSLNAPANGTLRFQIPSFLSLPFPLLQGVQLLVTRLTGSFYLGLQRAQFDNVNGYLILNPNDYAYQISGDSISQISTPLLLNGSPVTNKQAVANMVAQTGNTTFQLLARYQSPLSDTPALQPVTAINSVTGAGTTGVVASTLTSLVHTSDFLLYGGSNKAGDIVNVSTTKSTPVTATITALVTTPIPTPVVIDSFMDVPVDPNGTTGNVVSVISTDQSTLYEFGVDYTIVTTGAYRSYGIQPLTVNCPITSIGIKSTVVTVAAVNSFGTGASVTLLNLSNPAFNTVLGGQTLTVASSNGTSFTAVFSISTDDLDSTLMTGTATGSTIQNNQPILVTYNKFAVHENLNFISGESQQLTGTASSTLDNQGFVYNTWLPESYGNTTLTLDGAVLNPDGTVNVSSSTGLVGAQVAHDSRYIKVTYDGIVMQEGSDFTLTVDSITGTASISRSSANVETTRIPDGGIVSVSYFITEAFTFATEYPAFVTLLANQYATTKHACGDVLVKAMVANPVDVTMNVSLANNSTADVVDPLARTAVDIVLDNAKGTLDQSDLVTQVKGVSGIQSVGLPLVKCAKSDGSYNIGVVIPTSTAWIPLSSDPAFASIACPPNSFITMFPVLPDSTLPSGGASGAFISFLYQGQEYTWTSSINNFLTTAIAPATSVNSGYFYIIGTGDKINDSLYLDSSYAQKIIVTVPLDVTNPGLRSYFSTYQVWGEGTASDITLSSTEYFTPGSVRILYNTTQGLS